MLSTSIHLFSDDRFEVAFLSGTPSIYIYHLGKGLGTPIHFHSRRELERFAEMVRIALEMWPAEERASVDDLNDEIPF